MHEFVVFRLGVIGIVNISLGGFLFQYRFVVYHYI